MFSSWAFFIFEEGKFARLLRFQCPTTLLQSSRGYSGSGVERCCFKVRAVAQVLVSSKQTTLQRSFILPSVLTTMYHCGIPSSFLRTWNDSTPTNRRHLFMFFSSPFIHNT
eukprot:Gb_00936 [translate_table: standard]